MNLPPHDPPLVCERPVRSDFARSGHAREISYARRRLITLAVLAVFVGGTVYALWGHRPSNPADIPTIHAEGAYKQKPTDPGGIDIPHQDVQVYNELESKNTPSTQVEHLLPPPEMPKEGTVVALTPVTSSSVPVAAPPVAPPPVAFAPAPQQTSAPAAPKEDIGGDQHAAKQISTTVAPASPPPSVTASVPISVPASASAPASAVVAPPVKAVPPPAPATAPLSIEQVIADNQAPAPAKGEAAIQLASVPDEAKAGAMLLDLQKKYASVLGGVPLHLARADLGAKGIYYRIQSQPLTQEGANHICSSLKQLNAGCILVRK